MLRVLTTNVQTWYQPDLLQDRFNVGGSLRASSPIWASEASLARTRERVAKPRGARPLARVFSRDSRRSPK